MRRKQQVNSRSAETKSDFKERKENVEFPNKRDQFLENRVLKANTKMN
jgi:hypothetical protein